MPDVGGRRRAAVVAVLATTLLIGLLPSAAVAKDPPGLDRFLAALGRVESSSRYTARNPRTGAYGKYQIMPAMWRAWALRYLGNADARPTPSNQERLARAKVAALFRWLHDWRFVAHWWLTGSGSRNISAWSAYARRYVTAVMRRYGATAAGVGSTTGARYVEDGDPGIAYAGSWSVARYGGYSDDTVRYATGRGATASISFTGHRIVWAGPLGPTRGRATVSLDGIVVKTVDLYRSRFDASAAIYTATWPTAGTHRLTITVLGTSHRPTVAIDTFAIVP